MLVCFGLGGMSLKVQIDLPAGMSVGKLVTGPSFGAVAHMSRETVVGTGKYMIFTSGTMIVHRSPSLPAAKFGVHKGAGGERGRSVQAVAG